MTRRPGLAHRRPAFTLIEVLVVISIIVFLMGIAAGTFFRVRLGQQRSATDATLTKINSLIERRVKAVNDQVTDDAKNNHPIYAAILNAVQNPDLAKALYTHAKMKNELPMSVDEARFPVTVFPGITLPPKAIFRAAFPDSTVTGAAAPFFPTPPTTFSAGTTDESAACLYLAVTTNAGGGTAADTDGIQGQTGDVSINNRTYKAFKDAWGSPIAFVRTAYSGELSGPPFIRGGAPTDPFDPRQKINTNAVFAPASRTAWWANMRANTPAFAQIPATYPAANSAGLNHTWTAISAGVNKNFGTDIYGQPATPDTDPGKDNQLSYRLRREGSRGD